MFLHCVTLVDLYMHVLNMQVMPDVNRVLAQMKKFTEVFCLLTHNHVYIWLGITRELDFTGSVCWVLEVVVIDM